MYQGDKIVCMACDKDKVHTDEEVRSADGKCPNDHVIFLPRGLAHLQDARRR
jgi:hypothetical protein